MSYTIEEVLSQIEEEDVRFVRLAFRDAFGVQKNIAVMPGEVRKAFEYGISINARAVAGFAENPYASLYLKLMEHRHMTEAEAHRYIGKQAMDHGMSRKRIAQEILDDDSMP